MTPYSKKGFSLIEMLIYIAVVSLMMILLVNTVLSIINAYSDLRLARNIETSATVSFDRMIREIRGAKSVDMINTTFGVNPGRLVLNTTDSSGANTTIDFYVDSNLLKVKEGGVYIGPLTSSTTIITNLTYTLLSTTTSKAVKIDMGLSSTRKSTTKTGTFHDTVILRGSY